MESHKEPKFVSETENQPFNYNPFSAFKVLGCLEKPKGVVSRPFLSQRWHSQFFVLFFCDFLQFLGFFQDHKYVQDN